MPSSTKCPAASSCSGIAFPFTKLSISPFAPFVPKWIGSSEGLKCPKLVGWFDSYTFIFLLG